VANGPAADELNGPVGEELQAAAGVLAVRFGLRPVAARQLALLAEALLEPSAPTSVRDPAKVLDDHLADALVALELPVVRAARAIADLGSGGGVPGIPLAIALPEAGVALVESNGRKCAFLAAALSRCGVGNATAVAARAEAWPEGIGRFDLVTARALAPLDVVAEYAAPLLQLGGALVAWRGRRDPNGETAALRAADALGLEVAEPRRVQPYPGAEQRHLHVLTKLAETPARFPRRPGVARKRPLGSVR
jgi:16S rRNA (guanine527-N7)-methyltransferase